MDSYKVPPSTWNQDRVIFMKETLMQRIQDVFKIEERLFHLSASDPRYVFTAFNGDVSLLGKVFSKIRFKLIYLDYIIDTVYTMITTRDPMIYPVEFLCYPQTEDNIIKIWEVFQSTKNNTTCWMTMIEKQMWDYIKAELGLAIE